MNKQELLDKLGDRLPDDDDYLNCEDIALTALQTYADLRMPELEERLEQFENSQFKTYGKIDEMEKMKNL